jgi:ADP-ribose pyrophosphatase YjhB (NUDIX family)
VTLKLRHRVLQRGYLWYSRFSRGMTLGVRAMLIEGDGIVLVKHGYLPGWYLPGGGVEAGESLGEALAREVEEEAGRVLTGRPQLFGVYRNSQADRRDHVALFVCREWRRLPKAKPPNLEIAAVQRFPLDILPEDATPSTRARIREVFWGEPPATDW